VDENSEYVSIAAKVAETFARDDLRFQGVVGDSRYLDWIEDDSIGLVVTSPPYWNKADYGGADANLGNIDGYIDFIESLRPSFRETFRALMPGRKLCVVTANVSQHTDHGLLTFPLATDILVMLRDIGFAVVNEIIWSKDGTGGRWGSWGKQRPIFGSYPYPPNFLFKTVHEYILIVSKPPVSPTRGPKVKPLSTLMTNTNGSGNGRPSKSDL
jgi:DNA modification methylase